MFEKKQTKIVISWSCKIFRKKIQNWVEPSQSWRKIHGAFLMRLECGIYLDEYIIKGKISLVAQSDHGVNNFPHLRETCTLYVVTWIDLEAFRKWALQFSVIQFHNPLPPF